MTEEWLKDPEHTLSRWAGNQLSANVFDVLAHFLLTHRSKHTRMAYARDVVEFLDFAASHKTKVNFIQEITERLLLLWRESLTAKHTRFDDSRRRIANASVARKLCTISSLLDFALKRKLLEDNPMTRVKRPKVRRQSHANVLSEEELKQILNASQNHLQECQRASVSDPATSESQQQRALLKAETEWCMLVLLFTVGMRVSELCQLRLQDITPEGDLVRLSFVTKGARKHQPLVHPETARILLNYIVRFRAGASIEEPVFPASRSASGKVFPIHRSTVFRMVQVAARRAAITRNFSPHGCRATLATQLHLAEIPVVEIQSLLNHAQVTTTQLYLHRVDETKESAALKLTWAQKPSPL